MTWKRYPHPPQVLDPTHQRVSPRHFFGTPVLHSSHIKRDLLFQHVAQSALVPARRKTCLPGRATRDQALRSPHDTCSENIEHELMSHMLP